MADTESPPPPPPSSSSETHSPPVPPPPPPTEDNNNSSNNKGNTWNWNTYTADDLKRTVVESTDSAIRSARSLHENSSTHIQTVQDLIPKVKSQYTSYEDTFFKKVKDELMSAREHPVVAGGVAIATVLLLMRGPRRFLFRQTFGRLQSEEAQFNKFERNVTNLSLSVDTLKQESTKLLERAALAEEEMKRGHTKVLNAGSQIQRLAKSVYKVESQACDLMDSLREIPGRGALKLRAEVASMASLVKHQRVDLEKRIEKISDLGVPV